MMNKKILFIENRQKTFFWELLSEKFQKNGYEIYWIIQNHWFTPEIGIKYSILYPSKKDKNPYIENNKLDYIASTDRLINYFDNDSLHYQYYYKNIEKIIRTIQPDIIVGESTLFHEIMSIEIAKQFNILYLAPCGIAYPSGRFSFFIYDGIETVGFSDDKLENIKGLLDKIKNRNIIPTYIQKHISNKKATATIDKLSYKLRMLVPYILGERYNTPSPLKKYFMDKKTKKIVSKWNKLAESRAYQNKKTVLYPLQLQPEANLDVHGNAYRDQVKLVKEIAQSLPDDWCLLVKTNPKSKYELSSELYETILKNQNIIPLNSNMLMNEIFSKVDLIITVTGTIAQECFFSDKPFGVFGPSIVEKYPYVYKMNDYHDIKNLIELVEKDKYSYATEKDKVELLNYLNNISFPGLISDPISDPECMDEENIELVYNGFITVIESKL